MIFRHDIQELRGIAFLFVFIYHINSDINPGGYIGVDIFFVISGYIITFSLNEMVKNKSNIILFYMKRIKRLFPSSYICLLCYYFYHPTLINRSDSETEHYLDIMSGLLCCSNIRFYSITQSYFQKEVISIILNYWSLSLEEQFYFFYAIYFFYFQKFYLIIYIYSISLYLCISNTFSDNSSAYYFLSNRAWELLFGCITTFLSVPSIVDSKVFVYLLIISSYLIGLFTSLKFPGYIALIPTTLSALLLSSQRGKLFDNHLLSLMGNISYVLYLFHYPIIQNNKKFIIVVAKLLSVSYIVYMFIESPIRKLQIYSHVSLFSIVLCLLLFVSLSISIFKNKKMKLLLINRNKICLKTSSCSLDYKNIKGNLVILIGDSHLYQYMSIINNYLYKFNIETIVYIKMWTINLQMNYIPLANYINNLNNVLLCLFSFYVDHNFRYTNKIEFDKAFIYLIRRLLNVCKGIIVLQDNPHRIRKNDTICRKYMLPIIDDKRVTYIDIFNTLCKRNNSCIENIYSKELFKDMHHLNINFICNSIPIYLIITSAINKYISIKINKNITKLCYEIDLMKDRKEFLMFRKEFNFSVIKDIKFNIFGFANAPIFIK